MTLSQKLSCLVSARMFKVRFTFKLNEILLSTSLAVEMDKKWVCVSGITDITNATLVNIWKISKRE